MVGVPRHICKPRPLRAVAWSVTALALALGLSLGPSRGLSPGARAEQPVSPPAAAAFMGQLADQTLAVLRGGEASAEEKRAQVTSLIEKAFDLPLISRFVLGRFWRDASPAQLAEYQDLFTRSITKSYARALVASGGTALEVLDSKMVSETDALVSTRLQRSDGPPIGAGWRIRMVGGQARIVDVLHEGVSLAITQRQEYASVIEREGLEGLLAILRNQSG